MGIASVPQQNTVLSFVFNFFTVSSLFSLFGPVADRQQALNKENKEEITEFSSVMVLLLYLFFY